MLCIYIFIYLLLNQINVYQLVMNWKGPYKFSKVSKILETLLLMLLVLYFIIIIIIIILILILGFTLGVLGCLVNAWVTPPCA
jgi:uncharacterized membrane protein